MRGSRKIMAVDDRSKQETEQEADRRNPHQRKPKTNNPDELND